jgi:dolichol-phosphate mannosyltransferase
MSGYFILRRSVVESARLQPTGYKILLEVLAKGSYHSVREIPYIFEERKEGESKLGPKQYLEYLLHLARLARQTGEVDRVLRFCAVGTTGIVVNETALWFLTTVGGLYYIHASLGAVELAIISNYFLNEYWTFRDKADRLKGVSNRFQRFLKFNLICVVGGILNTTTLWMLTGGLGINYLYSNLAGIALGTIWNYWINANMTWGVLIPPESKETHVVSLELNQLSNSKVLGEGRDKV